MSFFHIIFEFVSHNDTFFDVVYLLFSCSSISSSICGRLQLLCVSLNFEYTLSPFWKCYLSCCFHCRLHMCKFVDNVTVVSLSELCLNISLHFQFNLFSFPWDVIALLFRSFLIRSLMIFICSLFVIESFMVDLLS